eukprot:scaffold71071_cov74-Phaeocystis_antarctica.AAC.1
MEMPCRPSASLVSSPLAPCNGRLALLLGGIGLGGAIHLHVSVLLLLLLLLGRLRCSRSSPAHRHAKQVGAALPLQTQTRRLTDGRRVMARPCVLCGRGCSKGQTRHTRGGLVQAWAGIPLRAVLRRTSVEISVNPFGTLILTAGRGPASLLATVSSATGALRLCQVGPGFARSHHSAGPAAQAPPSAGPSRKQSCPAVSRRSVSRATRCRHHHHSRAAADQRLSPSYPAGFARQISCLARAHADDRGQLCARRGTEHFANVRILRYRADDTVYAQQSGALQSIVTVAHGR